MAGATRSTREPESVALDVRREYVTPDAAREQYGVVLAPSGAPDLPATVALRADLRAQRTPSA